MRAVVWHGQRDVRVDDVADPSIQDPTDAMMDLFDKQIQLRMGQANVKAWIDDIMPLLLDDEDPLGVEDLATHRVPLSGAPQAYQDFQEKQDGTIKVLLEP